MEAGEQEVVVQNFVEQQKVEGQDFLSSLVSSVVAGDEVGLKFDLRQRLDSLDGLAPVEEGEVAERLAETEVGAQSRCSLKLVEPKDAGRSWLGREVEDVVVEADLRP